MMRSAGLAIWRAVARASEQGVVSVRFYNQKCLYLNRLKKGTG